MRRRSEMANKTILVTGSTGWLGGKLCEALVARGVNVVGQGCEYAAMPPLFEMIASGKIKVDQVLIELHHTKVGRRLRGDFGRTLQRFFAAADTAKLRITHKERNQWGCDGYRCVEYALVSEAFLREANGAVMCAT